VPSCQISAAADFVSGQGGFLETEESLAEFQERDKAALVSLYAASEHGNDVSSSLGDHQEAVHAAGTSASSAGKAANATVVKPHHSSGRQLSDLLRLRASLRQGAKR
jgi:hypothetical protein